MTVSNILFAQRVVVEHLLTAGALDFQMHGHVVDEPHVLIEQVDLVVDPLFVEDRVAPNDQVLDGSIGQAFQLLYVRDLVGREVEEPKQFVVFQTLS